MSVHEVFSKVFVVKFIVERFFFNIILDWYNKNVSLIQKFNQDDLLSLGHYKKLQKTNKQHGNGNRNSILVDLHLRQQFPWSHTFDIRRSVITDVR